MTRILFTMLLMGAVHGFTAQVADLRFQKAHELTAKGQYEDALQEYRALLLEDPDNGKAYLEAGQVRALQKKWNAAIRNFELCIQKSPTNWDAHVAMAESFEQLGQREKAIATWRKVADKAPESMRLLATGRIEDLLKNPASKEPSVKETTAKQPESKDAVHKYDTPDFIKGVAEYQAGQWAKALDTWRKVLSVEPSNPGAFYYAGVCRYNLGQYDKAEFNLAKSFKYPDKGFNAHYYIARIAEKQKNPAKARKHYELYIASTTNPAGKKDAESRLAALPVDKSIAQGKAGVVQSSSGSPQSSSSIQDTSARKSEVKPNPEKVVNLDVGIPFALGSLQGPGAAKMEKALKASQQKDYSQAMDTLKQVRLDYPGTANALAAGFNLVSLYKYLGLNENMRVLSSALLREPDITEPYLSALRAMLAKSLKDLGELQASRSVLDSVLTGQILGPTATEKHVLESQIAEMQKAEKDVPAILEKAIGSETDPVKRADLRLRLGQILMRQGLMLNAEKVFQELLASCSPYTADQCRKAQFQIADMQYKAKAFDKSIISYRKAVDLYPNQEDSPWGLYQIGNALRQQTKWSEALAVYESLIQKFPESYWAEQAKWNREDVVWRGQNAQILKGK